MTKLFKIQLWAVGIGIALMVIKFLAYIWTGSNAILTDALESIINVVAGSIGLYSLFLASKPKDEDHPYGHGKVEFLSAGFEGGLILAAGVTIWFRAVYSFFNPNEIERIDIGIILILITGVINYLTGTQLKKTGIKENSITLEASGSHLISDAWSTVALVSGLAVIYFTEYIWLDNAVALIFGGIIVFTGFRMVRKAIAGIMDEADPDLIEEIVKVLNTERAENWIDIHNFRVIKYGSAIHVDCHMTVPWYFNVEEAHSELKAFDALLNKYAESIKAVEVFIHTDPCLPISCAICQKHDCHVRKNEFKAKIEWNLENIASDKRHRAEMTVEQ